MRITAFKEDLEIIRKILKHLGLWEVKPRPPPKASCLCAVTHRQAGPPKVLEYSMYYSVSQLPASDNWLYVDPEYTEVYPPLEGHPA